MKDIRLFADTMQMELAIKDIRRYQAAYLASNSKPVLVRWIKGWYAVGSKGDGVRFYRPTEFRNMTDTLEKRRPKIGKPLEQLKEMER